MHDVTSGIPFFIENNESYQTLIDESYFTVIRMEGVYVCQVHMPVDLGDVYFELGRLGFASMEAYAEDGLLEFMLRKLGDVPLHDDMATGNAVATTKPEREEMYA